MPLTNSQYESILRTYEEKQVRNRHLLAKRTQEVYAKIPAFQEIEETIASISVSQGKKMLLGDEEALSELKDILHNLSMQKENLLVTNGFSKEYLQPIYDCTDCKDTGYIDGQKCHCFKNAMITLLYQQSNLQAMLEEENFSKLSFSYYEGDDLTRFEKAVETSKNFIKNFPLDYQNLCFYGTVGTGKSFLSNCIAKELIDGGYSVIYFSAIQLFETLSKYSFDYKSKEELSGVYNDIYTCDLLIIDDLGTEVPNSFTISQLFSCLNERHLRKKDTIISTNLSLENLCNTYSERIFSRLTNNFKLLKLSGPDIRNQK